MGELGGSKGGGGIKKQWGDEKDQWSVKSGVLERKRSRCIMKFCRGNNLNRRKGLGGRKSGNEERKRKNKAD